jgi:hypothetical protein
MIDEKNGTRPEIDHFNFGHVDIHNWEKTTCQKIQIISYHLSMTYINIIRVIDYHEILLC